jgi:hypothetical protein
MNVFASIRNRPTSISGGPERWRGADPSEPGARIVSFDLDITDDGAGHYLLVCFSSDGDYGADTWHATLAEAYRSAEQQFGVRRDEWSA